MLEEGHSGMQLKDFLGKFLSFFAKNPGPFLAYKHCKYALLIEAV